jgi:hypothetical protein
VVGLVGWVVSNVSVGGFKRHTIASHSLLVTRYRGGSRAGRGAVVLRGAVGRAGSG